MTNYIIDEGNALKHTKQIHSNCAFPFFEIDQNRGIVSEENPCEINKSFSLVQLFVMRCFESASWAQLTSPMSRLLCLNEL